MGNIIISDEASIRALSALIGGEILELYVQRAVRTTGSMLLFDLGRGKKTSSTSVPSGGWSLVIEWAAWRLNDGSAATVTSRSTAERIDDAIGRFTGQKVNAFEFRKRGRLELAVENELRLVATASNSQGQPLSHWYIMNDKGWSMAYGSKRRYGVEIERPKSLKVGSKRKQQPSSKIR